MTVAVGTMTGAKPATLWVGAITFTTPLRDLSPEQRQHLATLLGVIALEIDKGEHLACAQHLLGVPTS